MKVIKVEKLVKEFFDIICKDAEKIYARIDTIEDELNEFLDIEYQHINVMNKNCLQIMVEYDPKITSSKIIKNGIKNVFSGYEE